MVNRQQLCDVDLFSHRVSFQQNFIKEHVSVCINFQSFSFVFRKERLILK